MVASHIRAKVLPIAILCVPAFIAAGCGGDDGSSTAAGAKDGKLSSAEVATAVGDADFSRVIVRGEFGKLGTARTMFAETFESSDAAKAQAESFAGTATGGVKPGSDAPQATIKQGKRPPGAPPPPANPGPEPQPGPSTPMPGGGPVGAGNESGPDKPSGGEGSAGEVGGGPPAAPPAPQLVQRTERACNVVLRFVWLKKDKPAAKAADALVNDLTDTCDGSELSAAEVATAVDATPGKVQSVEATGASGEAAAAGVTMSFHEHAKDATTAVKTARKFAKGQGFVQSSAAVCNVVVSAIIPGAKKQPAAVTTLLDDLRADLRERC